MRPLIAMRAGASPTTRSGQLLPSHMTSRPATMMPPLEMKSLKLNVVAALDGQGGAAVAGMDLLLGRRARLGAITAAARRQLEYEPETARPGETVGLVDPADGRRRPDRPRPAIDGERTLGFPEPIRGIQRDQWPPGSALIANDQRRPDAKRRPVQQPRFACLRHGSFLAPAGAAETAPGPVRPVRLAGDGNRPPHAPRCNARAARSPSARTGHRGSAARTGSAASPK